MLRNIALKSLRDIRRGFLWWSLGLAGFVALIVSVYPTVHSNPSLEKLAQDYPEALQAYHYAVGDPLRNGVSVTHMAVLVAIAVAATAIAPWLFSRRDVAT